MVWYVQPMQLKDADGNPSGKWHLIAKSDEGGGFHVCSEQEFDSPEEAQSDRASQLKAKEITGFPAPWEVEELKVKGSIQSMTSELEAIANLSQKQDVHALLAKIGADIEALKGFFQESL
jgi:hypothetical protein